MCDGLRVVLRMLALIARVGAIRRSLCRRSHVATSRRLTTAISTSTWWHLAILRGVTWVLLLEAARAWTLGVLADPMANIGIIPTLR